MSRILQTRGPAAPSENPPPRQETERRAGATTTEGRVFAVALGVGVLHAVDDAVLSRQPGVPLDQHLLGWRWPSRWPLRPCSCSAGPGLGSGPG